MKRVITLLMLLLGVTTASFSQEINEIDFLTSGKWQLESVKIGEETQDFSKNNSWMVFHSDGKYEAVMRDDQRNGTWKFDEDGKSIKFQGDESLVNGLKIELLNKKELLFSATEGDVVYTMRLTK